MTTLFYRVKGGDLFRWTARVGGKVVGKGEPKSWNENYTDAMAFLRKRARRLAKQHYVESVRVQMATRF
jgi:hypothetical protein